MKLILVCLWHCSERMKITQQLDSVMRLDVVHAIAEHLQQSVQDSPSVRLKDSGQKLT